MSSPFFGLRFPNVIGAQLPNINDTPPDISQVSFGQPTQEVYQPEHKAQDALYQMIQNMPQRNNPGMLRKIAASMANIGTGDLRAGDQFMHMPYYQQMDDWKTKFDPTLQLANQERASNNTLRMIASDAARNDASLRRLDIQDRDLERKTTKDKADIALREKRAATYDWKTRNPNMELEVDKQGRIIGINPQTGQSQFITGADGKPVMSNELSEEDKINLQIKLAQTRGNISLSNAKIMEDERQKNRMELTDHRATLRKMTSTNDKAMSVSQDAAAWKLAQQQYLTDNPRHRKFWDERNQPTDEAANSDEYVQAIDGPGGVRERYNAIKARVKPSAVTQDSRKADANRNRVLPPTTPTPNAPANKSNTAPTQPTAQAGRVIVMDTQGRRYSLPAYQLQKAISQGYKEVKQ